MNLKIQLPRFLRDEPNPKLREKYRASYSNVGSGKPKRKVFYPGENAWAKRFEHYSQLRAAYPLFDKAILGLAGLVNSQGVFHKPAVNRKDETYALAEEACYRADQFRDRHYVNSKLYNTVDYLGMVGSCFWEITNSPVFDFRIPPMQEYIEPYEADELGNVTRWRQIVRGSVLAEWSSDELVLISWRPTTQTWPYGTGLGVGLETELEMLIDVETSVKDYSEKAAWPYEVLQLGDGSAGSALVSDDDYGSARTEWKNRKPGEGIATRNMPVEIKAGGTNSAPIRELAALCELMKDNVHDGLVIPPVSKLYNSTEASATVLTKHVMTILGQPLQWLIKEHYEQRILKTYMEGLGFSVKASPQAMFEVPDAHKKEEVDYWVPLVQNKVQTPMQVCDHLDLEYDEAYWSELERKEQEQFNQKLTAQQEKTPEAPQKAGESWLVTKVNKNGAPRV